jgi:hypothetical protein
MSQSRASAAADTDSQLKRLEQKVDVLTEAVLLLAHGAEDSPVAEPGGHAAADAARQAHEMLLALRQGERQETGT